MQEPSRLWDNKQHVRAIFDRQAAHYDRGPGVFRQCGERLAAWANVQPGMHVLDLACGTGAVSIAAAQVALPDGSVLGIDIAPEMLARARAESHMRQLPVSYMEMDIDHLGVADASMDVVTCGFALFFLPDLAHSLRQVRRVLRPGGTFAVSVWARDSFDPLMAHLLAQLRERGVEPSSPPWMALGERAALTDMLATNGFTAIDVHEERLTVWFATVEECVQVLPCGGALVSHLPPEERGEVLRSATDSVQTAMLDGAGVSIEAVVLFARGQLPSA